MDISHRFKNNTLIVDVSGHNGRLIKEDLDLFIDELMNLYNDQSKEVAINLTNKTYLNSSGLGDLIKIKDKLMDEGIGLILVNPTNRVVSLLEMVGVDQFFNVVGSEDEI